MAKDNEREVPFGLRDEERRERNPQDLARQEEVDAGHHVARRPVPPGRVVRKFEGRWSAFQRRGHMVRDEG